MNNYTELVKALRHCGKDLLPGERCKDSCPYGDIALCLPKLKLDAAAVIEELQAKVDRLTKENRELVADRPEMEEVNGHWEWNNPNDEQQLPKRGEWKETDMGWDGDTAWVCSVCGEPWTLIDGTPKENNMNFCPNCGSQMRGEVNERD